MHEIPIGHRGLLRLTITAHGQSLHSGSRDWQARRQGANAVLALADVLLALEQLDRSGDLDANLPLRSAEWGEWRTVMTPGTTFTGGSGQSIVPDRATAVVDVRLVEGVTHAAVIAQVQHALDAVAARRERITFDWRVDSQLPPTSIPADAAVVQAVRAACQALLGTQPPLVIAGPANEGYLLNAGGIPTICGFGPVGEGGHAPDEYVEVASLPLAAALYADTAVRLGAG
jgi:acetylornithine deacetylase/succinyl-diaminopimelate desuccinylase-like protein